MKNRALITSGLLLLVATSSCSFIVRPRVQHHSSMAKKLTVHELSSVPSENPEQKNTNILGKIANKVSSWFHPKKHEEEVESEVILSPRQTAMAKKETTAVQPYPWPFSTIEKSITKSLSKEQKKAKPLLEDAQKLIKKDKDLLSILGTPVVFNPIFSDSVRKSIVNGKSSLRIKDHFEIVGTEKSGIVTLIADAHAKGHIQHLRVDVEGIHYDIAGTKDGDSTHLLHVN